MKPLLWPRVRITTGHGTDVPAIAPLIISVSRATDIPGQMSSWFMERFGQGYVEWINPFNGRLQYVSFENVRVIVFWSKNPAPILPHLPVIHAKGITTLFQLTLNDYEKEGFEPGIPPIEERITTLRSLAGMVGKERVFWRFDPLILTSEITPGKLLEKISRIGNRIADSVCRLTVSFFSPYRTAVARMRRRGILPLAPSEEALRKIGSGLAELRKRWGIEIVTCAEMNDLSRYGIHAGSCIDPAVIGKLAEHDAQLTGFFPGFSSLTLFDTDESTLRRRLKDPGQRPLCGCMISKDIGQYGTCSSGCVYCYAQRPVRRADGSTN